MTNIENSILDAIDVLMDQRVSTLTFDKTVRATILEVVDKSIGKYRVQYQNSIFYAFSSDSDKGYKKGNEVYIIIHSNDFEKDATILGTVTKLGVDYLPSVSLEDRFTDIGNNLLTMDGDVRFCSYYPIPQLSENLLDHKIDIDREGLSLYKNKAGNVYIAATFKTKLPLEQQVGGGDYGIIVTCRYYNSIYKSHAIAAEQEDGFILRSYVLNVDTMTGQPYKYITPNRQYNIFEIEGNDLESIVEIKGFCREFPHGREVAAVQGYLSEGVLYRNENLTSKVEVKANTLYLDRLTNEYCSLVNGKCELVTDIFMKEIQFKFVEPLTDAELQGASLRLVTPEGAYFYKQEQTKRVSAVLRIKGNKVNYSDQNIDFYWFVKDSSITANSVGYVNYAGAGWRALNKYNEVDGIRTYTPEIYYRDIKAEECFSKHTTFKCVAVFKDGTSKTSVSAEVVLENKVATDDYEIVSSMGSQFAFNIGKTTLKVYPANGDTYYWARSINGEALVGLDGNESSIEVDVSEISYSAQYEVAIYRDGRQIGNAVILLTNGTAAGEYTLVLNNASQVFKYNAQGIAPNSMAIDEDERLKVIPSLSFDIYNDLGQKIEMTDIEKSKICDIKWIWCGDAPTSDESTNTMLTTKYTFVEDEVLQPSTNTTLKRWVLIDQPNFTYSLLNRYDTSRTDNNIYLEVNYKGHYLTASTRFTFTKDGEIGTNGTKYIARIVPKDSTIDHIFICNDQIKGYKLLPNGKIQLKQPSAAGLKAQLWDGSASPVYDQIEGPMIDGLGLAWTLVDTGRRTPNHKIKVDSSTGAITINNGQYDCASTIQVGISTNTLIEDVKVYYAGYPIDVSYSNDNFVPLVTGGYNHCMYESDGTRSNFNPQPFIFRLFDEDGEEVELDSSKIIWYNSWKEDIQTGNKVSIQPPDKYDGSELNNYIKVTYEDYSVVVSIDFYLNRYGLAAMNSWDGNSIKINEQGDQYILAPQIGAGQKESDNSFTGITMGKSFNVAQSNKNEVGLMGFSKGRRSIFLDAETGASYFGIAGAGQIQLIPDGAAVIQSGDYDASTGKGMQINFSSVVYGGEMGPYIRYGSGKFHLYEDGSIKSTAGTIASWEIQPEYLRSVDKGTVLYSTDNVTDDYGAIRINVKNKFKVYSDGAIMASAGTIGNIHITADSLYSGSKSTLTTAARGFYLNKNGDFELSNSTRSKYLSWNGSDLNIRGGAISNGITTIGQNGTIVVKPEGSDVNTFSIDTRGNLTANGTINAYAGTIGTGSTRWTIGGNGSRAWIYSGNHSSIGNSNAGAYLGTDGLELYASNRKYLRYNRSGDLIVRGGDISGGTINIGDGFFTADDSHIDLGDFQVDTTNRGMLMSQDEQVGMACKSHNKKNLWLWAGWNSTNDFDFVVNQKGEIHCRGDIYIRSSYMAGWGIERCIHDLYDRCDSLDNRCDSLQSQIDSIGDDDDE